MTKTIRVQYFALLRDQRGLADESLATAAGTPAGLYAELRARYGFTLPVEQLRVAVNLTNLQFLGRAAALMATRWFLSRPWQLGRFNHYMHTDERDPEETDQKQARTNFIYMSAYKCASVN